MRPAPETSEPPSQSTLARFRTGRRQLDNSGSGLCFVFQSVDLPTSPDKDHGCAASTPAPARGFPASDPPQHRVLRRRGRSRSPLPHPGLVLSLVNVRSRHERPRLRCRRAFAGAPGLRPAARRVARRIWSLVAGTLHRDPLGGIDREDQDDSAKSQVPTPKNTQNTALTLPISPLCGSLRRRPT